MKKLSTILLILTVTLLLSPAFAFANGLLITIDENGNGSIGGTAITGALQADPGPGGLASVLGYKLTGFSPGVQGDVFLVDILPSGPVRLDVLRFNGDGTVLFYSDNVDGFDDLADTPSPPGGSYGTPAEITEGALYTPGATDPGALFNTITGKQIHVTYDFESDLDAKVPEPSSLLLLGSGLLALAGSLKRRLRS